MKYAIMSEVHANPRALKVALEDARRLGCGKYVLLGDVTGYGYDVMIENKVNLPDWLVALLTVATRKSRCDA